MRARHFLIVLLTVAAIASLDAQGPARKARRTPARKAPAAPALTRVEAEIQCPAELGLGLQTKRRFCDVLTGRDPQAGILVTVPAHRGSAMLSFELHNRHTYSEELVKTRKAFREYTATIGVLTLDNTLIDRAIILSQFRTPADLFDRIGGGAGPGGMKAVAPTGSEVISIELPEDVGEQVSILGEKLRVLRADGEADTFLAPGRPIAAISNVMIEYRPAPARKTTNKR